MKNISVAYARRSWSGMDTAVASVELQEGISDRSSFIIASGVSRFFT
jgi:hypothetical protein